MNRSESKYFNTAVRMDKAFLDLLEKKDFAYITVKEICEKAGVNRSTFYLHYETVDDLLSESAEYITRQFQKYIEPESQKIVLRLRECPIDKLNLITPEYLTPYLRFIRENKKLFRTAMENAAILRLQEVYDRMFCHVFTPILDRFNVPQKDRAYMMAFYIHGLMAIATQWIGQDCADPMDYVISLMQKCVVQKPQLPIE
ncbi:MAG: TetR/AcrR family transcriptional regulator [Acutalibacteraceae bacterium]